MELSYFLAQLMGLSLAIFAVIGIFKPYIVSNAVDTFESNSLTSLFFGFTAIVLGVAIVLTHNIWSADWVGVITLFGWAALLKGVMYLAWPKLLLDMGEKLYSNTGNIRIVLFIAAFVGGYLTYKGFGL